LTKIIRQPVYDLGQRPFIVIWETTQACDLACRHCRAEAQPDLDPNALPKEIVRRLIDQVEEFGRPRPILIFTGGDPFKRRDLFDLVGYASQVELPCAVSPSGTPLLIADNLARLKEAGAKAISLSIDGSDAERHDDFRRVPGSFDLTVDGWRAARRLGLKCQINTTVTRYNLTDLPRIFRLVHEIGAMTWSLFFLVPTGRAQQEDGISAQEHEAVLNFLYDASKYISAKATEGHHYKRVVIQRIILEEKGIPAEQVMDLPPVYAQLKQGLAEVVDEVGLKPREEGVRRPPMHINAGNGFVFISQHGEVFPSGFLPLSGGNVRERSLVDIYRNSPLFRDLRDTSKYGGRCGRCEFVGVCGGSRSRAYAFYADPLAEDPACAYQPDSFPYQAELADKLRQTGSTKERQPK
jgi:radical SAM protein